MRIIEINTSEYGVQTIVFDNGSKLWYEHTQDCCETNYADFEQIDDLAWEHEFTEDLIFESVPGAGFRFGDTHRMFFIPCYSLQSGYYTSNVNIHYNDKEVLNVRCEMVFR